MPVSKISTLVSKCVGDLAKPIASYAVAYPKMGLDGHMSATYDIPFCIPCVR